MERINNNENKVVLFEHKHRYNWASQFISGAVLDIACGVGYGGEIFMKNRNVKSYIGMDVSEEAIRTAKDKFRTNPNIKFEMASLENIPLPDSSIDTVISLETLEHLDDVDKAIEEIHRVLSSEGIFLGSVPTKTMEIRSGEIYGKNPFHKRMFSRDNLEKSLRKKFKFICIGTVSVVLGSLFKIEGHDDISPVIKPNNNGSEDHLGSFVFFASNKLLIDKIKFGDEFIFGMDFIEQEADVTIPIRDAFKKAEKLVLERDAYIKELEEKLKKD